MDRKLIQDLFIQHVVNLVSIKPWSMDAKPAGQKVRPFLPSSLPWGLGWGKRKEASGSSHKRPPGNSKTQSPFLHPSLDSSLTQPKSEGLGPLPRTHVVLHYILQVKTLGASCLQVSLHVCKLVTQGHVHECTQHACTHTHTSVP